MRKILVPTDFSDNAMNALRYACELFKYDISKFFIMHAYQDEIYANNSLMTREGLEEATNIVSSKSKTQLEDILKQIHDLSPNPRHNYSIVSSNSMLLDETDKIADDENIDIIVMGTHGKANDKKLTFGSHTLQVLRYVSCPVLAIPENYEYKQPKHILFPTNYLIPYKRRELKLLCEMVSPYGAEIDMLYISKSNTLSLRQEDNQNFIKEELCKNKVNFITLNAKNITKTIYKYLKENTIDMLVMVNTRHSFLENILFQTTIDKVSLNVGIPFLALQNMGRC
jgi:nucleotide-binding universal stress UspA family protein